MIKCELCGEEKEPNRIRFPMGSKKRKICAVCFTVEFVEIYEALNIDWNSILEEELH